MGTDKKENGSSRPKMLTRRSSIIMKEQPRRDLPPNFVFLIHSLDIMTSAKNCVPKFMKPWVGPLSYIFYFCFAFHHYLIAPLLVLLGLKAWVVESWDIYVEGHDEPLRTQVWATWFVTDQYLADSKYLNIIRRCQRNYLKTADSQNVRVFGLGALNKAEWLNDGGEVLQKQVDPHTTKVAHGNTMTAAAVAQNVIQVCEGRGMEKKVFLTGATSKVGAAVAVYLAYKGYEVYCCTKSKPRFMQLRARLPQDAKGSLVMAEDMVKGEDIKLWIIGKNQPSVHDHIPQKGEAVVFSVPDPMNAKRRPDINLTNGAIFELPEGRYTPRKHMGPLLKNQLFACHTGCLVHAIMGWEHHELGEVAWDKLDENYNAAVDLGFRLPPLPMPSKEGQ